MTHNRLFIDLILEAVDIFLRTEMDLTEYLENENYQDLSFQADVRKIRESFSSSFIYSSDDINEDTYNKRILELETINTYDQIQK